MNTILSLLLSVINSSFSFDEKMTIAIEMIKAVTNGTISDMTSRELAERCYITTNRLRSFCQYLGFHTYNDLRNALLQRIDVRREQCLHHVSGTDINRVLDCIAFVAGRDFDKDAFLGSIQKLNDNIYQCPQVIMIGAVFPESLSLHYQEDMIIMGKPVYSLPVAHDFVVPGVDEDTLFITLSLTGRVMEYFYPSFMDFLSQYEHQAVITGNEKMGDEYDNASKILLPVEGDEEVGNTILLMTLQLMKLDYYQRYVEKQ